jgi:hypothetical protein
MSWTKRQLVTQAFESIGLAAYVFDLTADQLQSAVRQMDALIAGWGANGIRISYPLPTKPDDSDLDQDSGIPDWAVEAVYSNLAMRLAPGYGKTTPAEIKVLADTAYSNLVNQAALPIPERQLPQTMPRGSGTKPWRNFNNPFINRPQEQITAGSDGPIDMDT